MVLSSTTVGNDPSTVMAGPSRPKDGVASARLCPGHPCLATRSRRGCPDKPGHDELKAVFHLQSGQRMSALVRIPDPSRTSRQVRKVPVAEVADASGPVQDRADVLGFDGLP
jgi:hypothetical protein